MTRTPKPALAVLSLFVLTACGAGGDEAPEVTPNQDQTEPGDVAPDEGAAEGADAEEESADAQDGPQDGTPRMDDAMETITYPMQGYDGEITMGLLPPEVQGDSMQVSVVFEPQFENEDESVEFRELHGEIGSVLAPVVNDRENMKAYHVPRVSTNPHVQGGGWFAGRFAPETWASAIGSVEMRSGEQYVHWAHFPAPEDDIDTVDVAVVPGAQEFQNVQIDWGDTQPGSADTGESTDDEDDDDA